MSDEAENFVISFERLLPERHVLPKSFRSGAQQILDFPVKDDDIWIITFPKCEKFAENNKHNKKSHVTAPQQTVDQSQPRILHQNKQPRPQNCYIGGRETADDKMHGPDWPFDVIQSRDASCCPCYFKRTSLWDRLQYHLAFHEYHALCHSSVHPYTTGTTWMQEAVWLMVNKLDYETALRDELNERSPFIEESLIHHAKVFNQEALDQTFEKITNLPGRRVIKSHLHWGRLPTDLRKPNAKPKMIYVARHPKDVCISYYYFHRILFSPEHLELGSDLERFGNMFINDQVGFAPYWSHVFEFWNRRNDPNIFFVWYEEMKDNLKGVLTRLADFLEIPVPAGEEMKQILDHLSFESMKNNPAVNKADRLNFRSSMQIEPEHAAFIRKGQVNQWKDKMSAELIEKFDKWIQRNTEGTDFQFYAVSKP